MLSRKEIEEIMSQWGAAWRNQDLEGVLKLMHEDIHFENFTGARVVGKDNLRQAWTPWFSNRMDKFLFTQEDSFIDLEEQKIAASWYLDWKSTEKGYEGKPERRYGVDIMHFKDGQIIKKLTYCKTTVEIEGKKVRLVAQK
jgi:ketosteroid isomerase-like protein